MQIYSREVPISPSGSITWEVSETMNGALYLPIKEQDRNAKVAKLLQCGAVGTLIAEGKSGGRVYESPGDDLTDVVIKEFNPRIVCDVDRADKGNLRDLRANVMFATGINMLEQPKGPWQLRGVQVLGALILRRDPANEYAPHARWVVEKAHNLPSGHEASWFAPVRTEDTYIDRHGIIHTTYGRDQKPKGRPLLPTSKQRKRLYENAIANANGEEPKDLAIHFDDHPGNMILTSLPSMRGRKVITQGTVVKLDVRPLKGFDY